MFKDSKICYDVLTLHFFLQSLFERQGMTLHGGLHPGMERGHIALPKGMSRTKSFGKSITHPVYDSVPSVHPVCLYYTVR